MKLIDIRGFKAEVVRVAIHGLNILQSILYRHYSNVSSFIEKY